MVGRRPAGRAEEGGVIGEIGRDDRAARGEVDGQLALNRVVLAAGEPRMDQDVGATGQGDDLIGAPTGQDDEAVTVRAEAATQVSGRRPCGRAAHEDASGPRATGEDAGEGLDQQGNARRLGWDDTPDVHHDLVARAHARDLGRGAGGVVFGEVDAGIDDRDPAGVDALLLDHHPLDPLAQHDDRRGLPADGPFQPEIQAEGQAPAQAVALELLAQERVELVDQRPAIASAGEGGAIGAAVVLGMDEIEGEFAVDPLQARDPFVGMERERGGPLEIVRASDEAPERRSGLQSAPGRPSTPRRFSARRILIGSIAVPSYSPGTGKDVTNRCVHRGGPP